MGDDRSVRHRRPLPRIAHPGVLRGLRAAPAGEPQDALPLTPAADRLLPRELLAQSSLLAARALLGARLVVERPSGERRAGRIVEVEAYIGSDDLASHARFGRTARNAVMFGPPGIAYVYLVYGMYDCLNIVTEPAGQPAAVLVRAVEPLEGIESMRASRAARVEARRRRPSGARAAAERMAAVPVARLASGPGLVAAAFGIGRADTGLDLCDRASPVRLEERPVSEPPPEVVAGPRIGIDYAPEPWRTVPWRLAIAGSLAVSRPRPPVPGAG